MDDNGLVTITEEEYRSLREAKLMYECLNETTWLSPEWLDAQGKYLVRIGELDE